MLHPDVQGVVASVCLNMAFIFLAGTISQSVFEGQSAACHDRCHERGILP